MKLVRISAFAFVALSAACASNPPVAAPKAPTGDAVSTTRVNAATIVVPEDEATPRVGKPQRSDDASSHEELDAPKDEPRRNEGRRSWK